MENQLEFDRIAPRGGSQSDAFEELCCQIARRAVEDQSRFVRIRGDGGDGGIECYYDHPDSGRVGWQAKFVFDIGGLITQANRSLDMALEVHPELQRFVLCFPFVPTGKTRRRGKSQTEKLDDWISTREEEAARNGRELEIELWPASTIQALVLEHDESGGLREYFFEEVGFSKEWFAHQVEVAAESAGPRYTAELTVDTVVGEWFAAFGRTPDWMTQLEGLVSQTQRLVGRLSEALERPGDDTFEGWPEDSRDPGVRAAEAAIEAVEACRGLSHSASSATYRGAAEALSQAVSATAELERRMAADLESTHGEGVADSPGFRQFMAEYMVSFPAANLDRARETLDSLRELLAWLESPRAFLASADVFVLSGDWGVGKTHAVCDAASQRVAAGAPALLCFGHWFGGEPDPWVRIVESLGLPGMDRDRFLDALDAAGEAAGQPVILYLDAINETNPVGYWADRLNAFLAVLRTRANVRMCITCRTPYLDLCLPPDHDLQVVEHPGFRGQERLACSAFFKSYGLTPPVEPVLQPELANPLYLRLLCETLRARGLQSLPTGWSSTAQVVAAFLEESERAFARETGVGAGARGVTTSLRAVAREIASSGLSAISWSDAVEVVRQTCPAVAQAPVIEWMVNANLLIEGAPTSSDELPAERTVRPAFERLGDFLIAVEILDGHEEGSLAEAFAPGGSLHGWVEDSETIARNYGVLSALSIALPEREEGAELPAFVRESGQAHQRLLRIAVEAFPWRDPATFSEASEAVAREALSYAESSWEAMDSLVALAWRPSLLDAVWLSGLLQEKPLVERDAYWCGYLHDSWEEAGPVKRLIMAAHEVSLEAVAPEVALRWTTCLLWFAAAADRRVSDWATRSATHLLAAHRDLIPTVLRRFLHVDDDRVRERCLLASYGALLINPDAGASGEAATVVKAAFEASPREFDHALIRDHMRCLASLAVRLDCEWVDADPDYPINPIPSDWPLETPSEEDVKEWGQLIRFEPNEFASDFFKYSMGCLRPWEHEVGKDTAAEWIIGRVARDFGYVGSRAEQYDKNILAKYGGGRAKPRWAERIAKKYCWTGLFEVASRLHDHVARRRDEWEPKPTRAPLILLEERKLDPTIRPKAPEVHQGPDAWWVAAGVDLASSAHLTNEEWVRLEDDLPSAGAFLRPVESDGRRWRPLVAFLSWREARDEDDFSTPYRRAWVTITSLTVPTKDLRRVRDALHRRNFAGQWTGKGADWLYGFPGEYPWGIPFNTEPDTWHGEDGDIRGLDVDCRPTWNTIACEWEYDATLPTSTRLHVPARQFFEVSSLWWDGRDGYRTPSGQTVYRDPSLTEGGPGSLVAEVEDHSRRLDDLDARTIWTIVGEKQILGRDPSRNAPPRTFSQLVFQEADGSLWCGDRVFFDRYDEDTGPAL